VKKGTLPLYKGRPPTGDTPEKAATITARKKGQSGDRSSERDSRASQPPGNENFGEKTLRTSLTINTGVVRELVIFLKFSWGRGNAPPRGKGRLPVADSRQTYTPSETRNYKSRVQRLISHGGFAKFLARGREETGVPTAIEQETVERSTEKENARQAVANLKSSEKVGPQRKKTKRNFWSKMGNTDIWRAKRGQEKGTERDVGEGKLLSGWWTQKKDKII